MTTLFAQHNEVIVEDVVPKKVEKIDNCISPIQDDYIKKYFAERSELYCHTRCGSSILYNNLYIEIQQQVVA